MREKMTKIVFLNIIDATPDDYKKLQFILSSIDKDKEYDFVVTPKTIKSTDLDDLKELVEVLNDKHERHKDNAEGHKLDEDQDRGTEQLEKEA